MTKRLGDHIYQRPPGKKSEHEENSPWTAQLGHYIGITTQYSCSIALFGFGGWYLDKLLGTAPVFLIIGIFAGSALGFYYLIRSLKP